MRAVEGFLRRRIASALPIGFATLPDTGEQLRFVGEPTRMRFVADLPDYLGRGGAAPSTWLRRGDLTSRANPAASAGRIMTESVMRSPSRSDESRRGKSGFSTCRSRWSQ